MNCKEYSELLSLYVDGLLVGKELENIKTHIANCEDCRREYEELMLIKETLGDFEMIDLPEEFEQEFHEKLVLEANKKKTNSFDIRKFNFKNINKKVSFGVVAAVVMLGIIVGPLGDLNQKNDKYYGYEESSVPMESKMAMNYEETTEESNDMAKSADIDITFSEQALDVGTVEDNANYSMTPKTAVRGHNEISRKIIRYGNLSIRVLDFDLTIKSIENKVNSMGGYVENYYSEISDYDEYNPENSLKYGNINVRIPKDKFDSVFGGFGELGIVQNSNVSTSDVTDSYRDTQASLDNLKVREEALREIMKKAVEIKDVIEVERELSRVRTEIDQLTGRLKNWDNKVEYSSLSIEIIEVRELKKVINPVDKTLWEKSVDGLRNTINNLIDMIEELVIFVVSYIPVIVVMFVLVVLLLVNKRRKKNEK